MNINCGSKFSGQTICLAAFSLVVLFMIVNGIKIENLIKSESIFVLSWRTQTLDFKKYKSKEIVNCKHVCENGL